MINPQLLDILRCPIDPGRLARLEDSAEGLVCTRCRVIFPVREGIASQVPEDATLPAGCKSLGELPCRQKRAEASS